MLVVVPACSATNSTKPQADSCLSKVLGDSISNMITSSKTIKSYIWKRESGKTIKSEERKLDRKQRYLLHFILANPLMSKTNAVVYGKFTPCIGFEFKKTNRKKVYADIDLGLGKWSVRDTNGKLLKCYDIEGYALLQLCALLYPSDEFIMGIYNNRLNK